MTLVECIIKRGGNMNDTIVAISTAMGEGAISIIRVSGRDAIDIVNSLFNGKDLEKADSHTINYGHIVYKDEIIEIGEKILRNCTDDDIRLEAKARLGCHLCEIGETEKGRAVIETLPSKYFSREEQIRWAITGDEQKQYYGKKSGGLCSEMLTSLISYVDVDDHEAVISAFNAAEKIYAAIYDENDYGDNYYDLAVWYTRSEGAHV